MRNPTRLAVIASCVAAAAMLGACTTYTTVPVASVATYPAYTTVPAYPSVVYPSATIIR